MFTRKTAVASLIGSVGLLVGSLLIGLSTPATANPDSPEAVAKEAAATGITRTGFFVFEKNRRNPSNSKLHWQEWIMIGDQQQMRKVLDLSWRAGSGNGSTDSCASNAGWLPNGRYGGKLITGFDGDINGIVFQLNDKKCGTGETKRTELFIHSEMTPSGGQNPNVESERWDGRSDYKSLGCIKLRPQDIKEAANRYSDFYGASAKHYKHKLLIVTHS
jgi:hypothetical protein